LLINITKVSGQGPYYGQAIWFTKFHPEPVQSAKERYYKEIKRVTSVLEAHLKTQDKGTDGPWLVGGKYSYADTAFFSWQNLVVLGLGDAIDVGEFTEVAGWMDRMRSRPAIKKALEQSAH
jgi:glutathione S-transferase